ncbi:MAG: hypothetical protein ABSB01_26660 [Streptosporangiaceae bacterium]|jgi:ABC-type glycerol-3-phosphate transport system substrate-binding protein
MNNKAIAAIGTLALAAGIGLAACGGGGSSSPSGTSGTETLHGMITGSAAMAFLNSNSNAPFVFPSFTFSGSVNTTVKALNLGGGGNGAEHTFVTPAGD